METLSRMVLELYRSARALPVLKFHEHAHGIVREAVRCSGRASDSTNELHTLALLLPHILEAQAINRLIRSLTGEPNTVGPAMLGRWAVASPYGTIVAYDDEFVSLMHIEWPAWDPPTLPRAILGIVSEPGVHIYQGGMVAIRIERVDSVSILFARATQHRRNRLTPAEYSVAAGIARGATYKEVARDLGLSPATVRNHIHAAYTKLGTHNKAALARCVVDAYA